LVGNVGALNPQLSGYSGRIKEHQMQDNDILY